MKKPKPDNPRKPKNTKARADLDRWQNTPAVNPFYQGKTPVEVARRGCY